MNQYALGLIETAGYTAALSAADAALKAAKVNLVGVERVIGVSGSLGVTIQLSGDVGAVQSAVEAGKEAAERVGKVISAHVIPRSHNEVNEKLLPFFTFEKKEERSTKNLEAKTEKKSERVEKKKESNDVPQGNETMNDNQSE
jgi:ethanolamine utilization protein EutM